MSLIHNIFHAHTSILDRYITRQYFGPFFLAVGAFVIIGIIDILFTLVDYAVNYGVPFLTIFRLLIYKIPAIMVLFFPMAVLFSVMLMLVRMAKDNEITVLRSSGIHSGRILIPILIVAFSTALLSYFTNEKVVPWADRVSNNLIRKAISKKPPPVIVENQFFKDQDKYFYVRSINKKEGVMKDILIYELSGRYPKIISASEGYWNKLSWKLVDGHIQNFNDQGIAEDIAQFATMLIHVDRSIESFYTKQKSTREMDSTELKTKIDMLDKGGVNTMGLKVEYYMKKAIPGSCLVFGLIGIAFCLTFVRSGKDWWGVIMAVCMAVLSVGFFFFLVAIFRSFGKGGIINPFLAAWLPNFLYTTASLLLIGYQSFFR